MYMQIMQILRTSPVETYKDDNYMSTTGENHLCGWYGDMVSV